MIWVWQFYKTEDNHSVPKYDFIRQKSSYFGCSWAEICLPISFNWSRFFWSCRASPINDIPINWQLSRQRVSPLLITPLNKLLLEVILFKTFLNLFLILVYSPSHLSWMGQWGKGCVLLRLINLKILHFAKMLFG